MKKPTSNKFKNIPKKDPKKHSIQPKPEKKAPITEEKKIVFEAKTVKKTLQFPNISRIITERLPFKKLKNYRLWILAVCIVLSIGIVVASFFLYNAIKERQQVETEKEKVMQEINYWENVVSEHKDYRDGFFKLALLEYQIGNKQKSWEYLQKSLELDPNFEKGRDLEKMLRK
jgi:tetratricopeptide (TPR) repeat protein